MIFNFATRPALSLAAAVVILAGHVTSVSRSRSPTWLAGKRSAGNR